MNRSKIEWCDHTWNPITGCFFVCPYCYARTMSNRFSGNVRKNKMAKDSYEAIKLGSKELYVLDKPMKNETGSILTYPFGYEPTLHRYRLDYPEKLKMGNNIFVGAMADVFGPWVPEEWILEIFQVCEEHPKHNYMFLTKNPGRYLELEKKGLLPDQTNMWYGFSYTNNDCQIWEDMDGDKNRFVSVEPILEDLELFDETVLNPVAKWVIIGAETGKNRNKVVPEKTWVDKILCHCDRFQIPVFMKDSMISIIGEKYMRREFPKELERKEISEKMKDKLFDICCDCGAYLRKNQMVTMTARYGRGTQPKNFCYLCPDCFERFCTEHGIEIPKLSYVGEKNEK